MKHIPIVLPLTIRSQPTKSGLWKSEIVFSDLETHSQKRQRRLRMRKIIGGSPNFYVYCNTEETDQSKQLRVHMIDINQNHNLSDTYNILEMMIDASTLISLQK